MANSNKKTVKKEVSISFDLYPTPNLHTNNYQLGFDAKDIEECENKQRTSKREYFDYMIKLLGGEENIKGTELIVGDGIRAPYWKVTLKNVMNMYKAKEALQEIERIEPYTNPETKIQQERNYFLFREPYAEECRIYANLQQGNEEGIAILIVRNDFAALAREWKEYLDGKQQKDSSVV